MKPPYDRQAVFVHVQRLRSDDRKMSPISWHTGFADPHNLYCTAIEDKKVLLSVNKDIPAFDADAGGIARLRNYAGAVADQLEAAADRIVELQAEVLELRRSQPNWDLKEMTVQRDALLHQVIRLRAEVGSLRPVVDASIALRNTEAASAVAIAADSARPTQAEVCTVPVASAPGGMCGSAATHSCDIGPSKCERHRHGIGIDGAASCCKPLPSSTYARALVSGQRTKDELAKWRTVVDIHLVEER